MRRAIRVQDGECPRTLAVEVTSEPLIEGEDSQYVARWPGVAVQGEGDTIEEACDALQAIIQTVCW